MQEKNKREIRIKADEARKEISETVRSIRYQLGITQKEMAQTIGVSTRDYVRLESGNINPYVLLKYLKAFDLFPPKIPAILQKKS